jgi:hypothetical protein
MSVNSINTSVFESLPLSSNFLESPLILVCKLTASNSQIPIPLANAFGISSSSTESNTERAEISIVAGIPHIPVASGVTGDGSPRPMYK